MGSMQRFLVLEDARIESTGAGVTTVAAGTVIDSTQFDVEALRNSGVPLLRYDAASMDHVRAAFMRQRGRPGREGDLTALVVASGTSNATQFYPFFSNVLMDKGFSDAQVLAGLIQGVFTDISALPATPPSGTAAPAFAIVNDGATEGPGLAYYDFAITNQWILTRCPFDSPLLLPGHLLAQDPAVGSGANNWTYDMGLEFRATAPCAVLGFSVKYGGPSQAHAWNVRRSTVPGPTAPGLATYTDVLASGVITHDAANVWKEEAITGVTLAPDDWIIATAWVGSGQGQSAPIATLRAAGQLNESFGVVNAGVFRFLSGSPPGSNDVPTSRITATIYGVTSVLLGGV